MMMNFFNTLVLGFMTQAAGPTVTGPAAYVRPFFSADLVFQAFAEAPATGFSADGFKVYYYNEAEATCAISPEQIRTSITGFNGWPAIEKYIPGAEMKWRALPTAVGVDYFHDGIEQHASFQVKDIPAPGHQFIGLDCRLFYSSLWETRLAHEMAHVLLSSEALPIWMEEMIAQSIEIEMQPSYLARAVKEIGLGNQFPNPLDMNPFHDKQKYYLNALLGVYLQKSLLKNPFSAKLLGMPLAARRGKAWPEDLTQFAASFVTWLPAQFVPAELLKNFYVTLLLDAYDLAGRGVYKISGWNGFKAQPLSKIPNGIVLQPGAALRVTPALALKILRTRAQRLEFLMVNKSGQEFKIFMNEEIAAATTSELQNAAEVIVLNTSTQSHFEW